MSRLAGCTIPLFSLRSRRGWGIGQITDLVPTAAWLRTGGMRLLQILPPYELAEGETSPYGARTAFGLDPLYVDLDAVPDFGEGGPEAHLDEAGRRELARLRASSRVDYAGVRALKTAALKRAFDAFYEREWLPKTARALALRDFVAREKAWADDLALYVALRESHDGHGWETWPEGERTRDAAALARAREVHARRILEHHYGQWLAHEQWQKAREGLGALGVELMGDLPFVVGRESADVWSHARQFRSGVSLGAPPDDFAPEGQHWNLPVYDWAAMDADHLGWISARTRHAAKLYDRFRLDHVVGYFRMYVTEEAKFDPEGEDAQRARGRTSMQAMIEGARPAKIIAEDLGTIPEFVREELRALEIPGYRVIPWERDYVKHVYRTPDTFLPASVASWSTHDTAPITSWWHEMQGWEQEGLSAVAGVSPSANDDERWTALMRTLFEARSDLILLLGAEVLGGGDRINTPGVVGPENWTCRLPMPLEDLQQDPRVRARMESLRAMAEASGRWS